MNWVLCRCYSTPLWLEFHPPFCAWSAVFVTAFLSTQDAVGRTGVAHHIKQQETGAKPDLRSSQRGQIYISDLSCEVVRTTPPNGRKGTCTWHAGMPAAAKF